MAGLKDKDAVTRQHLSVHLPDEDSAAEAAAVEALSAIEGFHVHWADRHTNKLKRGHLAGNRFVIRVRDVEPTTAALRLRPLLADLERRGMPNRFGTQRFGAKNRNADYGAALLRGEALDHRPSRVQQSLYVSAWQSAVFNDVVAERVAAGTLDRLEPGDLAFKHDSGASFAVDAETASTENAPGGRVPGGAVSPSGPMWGRKMARAAGAVDAREVAALGRHGLDLDRLMSLKGDAIARMAAGARRPLRVIPRDLDFSCGVDEHGAFARLTFELPPGSYATVLLEEVMGGDVSRVADVGRDADRGIGGWGLGIR